jgi:hypothetical protein
MSIARDDTLNGENGKLFLEKSQADVPRVSITRCKRLYRDRSGANQVACIHGKSLLPGSGKLDIPSLDDPLPLSSGWSLISKIGSSETTSGAAARASKTSGVIQELQSGTYVFVSQREESIMRSIALSMVILLTETSLVFAQGHMGAPQEQQACRRDAQRFCRQQLGNDGAVQGCLQQNRTKLSKNCQKVFAGHGM